MCSGCCCNQLAYYTVVSIFLLNWNNSYRNSEWSCYCNCYALPYVIENWFWQRSLRSCSNTVRLLLTGRKRRQNKCIILKSVWRWTDSRSKWLHSRHGNVLVKYRKHTHLWKDSHIRLLYSSFLQRFYLWNVKCSNPPVVVSLFNSTKLLDHLSRNRPLR
jgi:hypothetical protein